jgi:hypothetical protein
VKPLSIVVFMQNAGGILLECRPRLFQRMPAQPAVAAPSSGNP